MVGMDGRTTIGSLETLLKDMKPQVDMDYDYTNSQVLVIAEPDQHVVIAKMLEQLKPEDREVEVFTLRRVDPFAAESAIDSLFADLPFSAAPAVDTDEGTQQLIVRATQGQIERIRQLLEKMGESPEAQRDRASEGLMRVVPFTGDIEATLKQIEAIWPQLRSNPMRIVVPDAKATPQENPPARENSEAAEPANKGADKEQPASDRGAQSESASGNGEATVPIRFASNLRQAEPDPPADPAAITTQDEPGEAMPPIVVIPGRGRVTIASGDKEALDQLEALLQTLQKQHQFSASSGNFAVYLLRNADAEEVADTLSQLFRSGSRSSSSASSYRSRSRRRDVMIVADGRLNAVLVQGTPADREIVEEMIQVLDSIEPDDSLMTPVPRMITVENLAATRVLEILNSVYRTQLTASSGLKQVDIPQGISYRVATALLEANAAAAAPLLTLDVDTSTNAILMRAPVQLGKEIEEFVRQLDEQAGVSGAQSVSLVSLKQINSRQVQEALQQLRGRSRYRGR